MRLTDLDVDNLITWRRHAACRGADTGAFFDPDRGDEAQAFCDSCTVVAECDQAADRNHETGFWAGRWRGPRIGARRHTSWQGHGVDTRCGLSAGPHAARRAGDLAVCVACRAAAAAEKRRNEAKRRTMEP